MNLDKTKVYAVRHGTVDRHTPMGINLQKVKILFEDSISWYVESLTTRSANGYWERYTLPKRSYLLIERGKRLKTLIQTVGKVAQGLPYETVCNCVWIYDANGYPVIALYGPQDGKTGVCLLTVNELSALATELATIWNERVDKC